MSQMLKSSGAMGIATLASRILGMVREMLYAYFMGTTWVAGAFKLAFMVPNLFRRLLGEGALTAAFIPLFKEKEKTVGETEMWHTANAVISGLMVAAGGIIGILLLGISVVLAFDAPRATAPEFDAVRALLEPLPAASPGFLEPGWLSPKTRLMLELLRWMLPYLLLVCLAAVFIGILNSRGHFFVPALAAAILNVTLIASVLWLTPFFGETPETQVFALAVGVLAAGVAQILYLWPTLRREGFRYRWVIPWRSETVSVVVRKMVPGMMGVAAFQLNVVLTNGIAFAVNPEIYASFDYAVRLMELPQGVFGISLATFLLPALAGLAAEKKYAEFRGTLGQAMSYLILGNLLASALLIVLAEPIVRLLFERGEFDPAATKGTALALACLAPGLIAFSLVNILARAFYALGDTATPMKISAFCLGLNVIFVFILIHPFAQGGLGIANSLSASINVWLLLYALRRKLKFLDLKNLRAHLWTFAGGGILAAQVAWLTSQGWERWIGHAHLLEKIGAVFVPILAACIAYGAAMISLQVPGARDLMQLLTHKLRAKR